jgi:hypothetical protein
MQGGSDCVGRSPAISQLHHETLDKTDYPQPHDANPYDGASLLPEFVSREESERFIGAGSTKSIKEDASHTMTPLQLVISATSYLSSIQFSIKISRV